jgi:hypothetical protein
MRVGSAQVAYGKDGCLATAHETQRGLVAEEPAAWPCPPEAHDYESRAASAATDAMVVAGSPERTSTVHSFAPNFWTCGRFCAELPAAARAH